MTGRLHLEELVVSTAEDVRAAAAELRQGRVVAIPTETVYGLAGAIDKPAAIAQIFALKERPFFDPLIVHIAERSWLSSVAREVPAAATTLMDAFWPGPLTLVLPRHPDLNPMITSGLDTVGVRLPSHPIAHQLLLALGVPLAAPSANKFGRTSPTQAAHVRAEWPSDQLTVLEGGASEVGVESTVVRVIESPELVVEILRPGGVSAEAISMALESAGLVATVRRAESEASPGHLLHHYMPAVPLVVVPRTAAGIDVATIAIQLKLDTPRVVTMELSDDPALAARLLYAEMRRAAESGADLILCPAPLGVDGLWAAIWDRLNRAATLIVSSLPR